MLLIRYAVKVEVEKGTNFHRGKLKPFRRWVGLGQRGRTKMTIEKAEESE